MKPSASQFGAALLLLIVACLAGGMLQAQTVLDPQERGQRLVLKDGSYQPVRNWELKGDRVRFYSTDRYQWEEMPAALVDWEATERYEQERQTRGRQFGRQSAEERRQEAERMPTVAPGVRLPEGGGVFLLDEYDGQPQLIELVQSGGRVRAHTRGNILRAAINPLARARQTIEVRGSKARIQAHPLRPAIYINLEGAPEEQPEAGGDEAESDLQPEPDVSLRYRLVRLESKRNARVVGNLRIALTGRVTEEKTYVPSTTAQVSPQWVKIAPEEDLEPGEYALVELLTAQRINLYVWDFGVDPNAPANPATWTPPAPVEIKSGTKESPVLLGRPD